MKDVTFQIIKRLQQLSLCLVELVKLSPVYRYSVDILTYSGLSGIFKQDSLENVRVNCNF